MSQLVFPYFGGRTFPSRTVIAPPVSIKPTPSGREFRARDSSIPKYAYSVGFDCLRVSQALAEYQTLVGFFNRVGGTFDDWLFQDLDDNTATNELFQIADGTTALYQLGRSFGGFFEPVFAPGTGLTFTTNGSAATPSVSVLGQVAYGSPPPAGAELRWTGPFYWRCRFKAETLELLRNFQTFYEAKKVEFVTVKPL
ncbi:MAG: hypothetical protein SHS37scaffold296_10 [Burkholderiales phage 68_11]|nr:MAG: hypothetical protein SHS37scaffold296_10 [Burkholderiales phage 68_11]